MADFRKLFIIKDSLGDSVDEKTEDQIKTWHDNRCRAYNEKAKEGYILKSWINMISILEQKGYIRAYGNDISMLRLIAEHCPVCGEFCESNIDTGDVHRGIYCGH